MKRGFAAAAVVLALVAWLGTRSFVAGADNRAPAQGIQWQAKDVQVVHVYGADSKTQASKGISASAEDGKLVLKLDGQAPWSDVMLTELSPLDPRGVVRVDLDSIEHGDTTVQVACWDGNGTLLDSFDLLKAMTEPGSYEMPLSAYRSAFPEGTKQISFRIWVGGKPDARASYNSIAYGISTSAPVAPPPEMASAKFEPAREGTWNIQGKPPFVLAHYVDWFSLDQPLAGAMWEHWSWKNPQHGHDATQRLPNGRRDIASVVYPLIGPYNSNDPAVVHYHLATMKAAGISGIIVDWYGKGHGSDECLPVIFDQADKLGMKVALCFEEKMFCVWKNPQSRQEMMDNVVEALSYGIKTWTAKRAYLRRDGVPFMMQFNSWGVGKNGPAYLTPDECREVFARLPGKLAFCRQNIDAMYHPIIPAAYVWWSEGNFPREFASRAVDLRSKGRMEFFMSMLGVGFNDTGVWGWGDGARVSKTYGVKTLQHTEENATFGDPELIQCVTWNDFNEGTCFEPTVQNGFALVDEVEKFIGRIHGRPVNLADNRAPYEEYVRTCSPQERAELPAVDPEVLKPK